MEVVPGIHLIRLPLGAGATGYVNAYLLEDRGGWTLVDCGRDTPETLGALRGELRARGADLGDLRQLIVTHYHSDHYGLAGTLARLAPLQLMMSRVDWLHVRDRLSNMDETLRITIDWLDRNGLATGEWTEAERRGLSYSRLFTVAAPDRELAEGDTIQVGDHLLEVLLTPGHTHGHLCLYDRERRLLLSGDHVLDPVTPHVAIARPDAGDPLSACLASLRKVGQLEVDLVLPGHGKSFTGLARRVGELLAHHAEREARVLEALSRRPSTGTQVARQLRWSRNRVTFDQLPPLFRRLALGQTVAHLEKLRFEGRASCESPNGLVYYRRVG